MTTPLMTLRQIVLLLLPLFAGCAAIAPATPIVPLPEVAAPQPSTVPLSDMVTTQLPTLPLPAAQVPQPTAPLSGTGASAAATPRLSSTATSVAAAPTAIETKKKSIAPAEETPAAAARPPAAPATAATGTKPAQRPLAAVPSPTAPTAPPSLDLNALKEQLKETKAIGVFTKLSLKNQVDDLLQQFRDFYQGKAKITMAQLRRSYDLLLMKVLSLIQDADQRLASAIVASREAIWGLLADKQKFSTLET